MSMTSKQVDCKRREQISFAFQKVVDVSLTNQIFDDIFKTFDNDFADDINISTSLKSDLMVSQYFLCHIFNSS